MSQVLQPWLKKSCSGKASVHIHQSSITSDIRAASPQACGRMARWQGRLLSWKEATAWFESNMGYNCLPSLRNEVYRHMKQLLLISVSCGLDLQFQWRSRPTAIGLWNLLHCVHKCVYVVPLFLLFIYFLFKGLYQLYEVRFGVIVLLFRCDRISSITVVGELGSGGTILPCLLLIVFFHWPLTIW